MDCIDEYEGKLLSKYQNIKHRCENAEADLVIASMKDMARRQELAHLLGLGEAEWDLLMPLLRRTIPAQKRRAWPGLSLLRR